MATAVSVAMSAPPFEARRVLVGRIFERAFAAIRHNPLVTIALVFLLCVVPGVGFQIFVAGVDRGALVMTVAGYALPGVIALFLLNWFVSQVLGVLAQGAMAVPVLAEDEGRKAGAGESLVAVGRSLLSLLLFGALLGIGVEIGSTLLIVPGILIYLLWVVVPSAVTIEREGMFMALNRSQELTEGSRWKIFGILLLLEAVNLILTFGMAFTARFVIGVSLAEARFSAGYLILMGLISMIVNLSWGTVQASLYVELVRSKEGASPERLVDVFA